MENVRSLSFPVGRRISTAMTARDAASDERLTDYALPATTIQEWSGWSVRPVAVGECGAAVEQLVDGSRVGCHHQPQRLVMNVGRQLHAHQHLSLIHI